MKSDMKGLKHKKTKEKGTSKEWKVKNESKEKDRKRVKDVNIKNFKTRKWAKKYSNKKKYPPIKTSFIFIYIYSFIFTFFFFFSFLQIKINIRFRTFSYFRKIIKFSNKI